MRAIPVFSSIKLTSGLANLSFESHVSGLLISFGYQKSVYQKIKIVTWDIELNERKIPSSNILRAWINFKCDCTSFLSAKLSKNSI